MKNLNLKLAGTLALSLLTTSTFAQDQWKLGGNTDFGPPPAQGLVSNSNYLGSLQNTPIVFGTNGINRMHINENTTSYLGIPTPGYIGIGFNPTDVRSRLTITGTNNTFFGGGGFRAWMKTGVFNLENSDNLYIGMKAEGFNRSDAILAFGDDNTGTLAPYNNFRILFTNAANPDGSHLEIARYTADGNVGFGPVFTNVLNERPMSLHHLNRDLTKPTWLQITNQFGTNQLDTDGLRLGVEAGINASGYLRWQENTPFIFQTDWDAVSGGTQNGERMRITSISAPGVPDPAIPGSGNITRVAISHNGAAPITQPRSLLHLGYNTGGFLGSTVDGWRDWMDVGTLTAQGSDNMYVGLKREQGFSLPVNDRYDAVISWGDNQFGAPVFPIGPDYLRFIFTSTIAAGAGDPVSTSNDGLEVARFFPGFDTTFSYLLGTPTDFYGRFGIGDFTAQGVNEVPTHKLDVVGNGRFRYLPDSLYLADSLVHKVVMVDTMGVLRWADVQNMGVGNFCSDPQVPISSHYEIALDSANYYFSQQGNSINSVAIGLPCSTFIPFARLQVFQSSPNPLLNPGISFAGQFDNVASGIFAAGIWSTATGSTTNNYGGYFNAANANTNIGVYAQGGGSLTSYAGYFQGNLHVQGNITASGSISDVMFKTNVNDLINSMDLITQLAPKTFEYDANSFPDFNFETDQQMGLIAQEVELVIPAIVSTHTRPAKYDSLGNELLPELSYKSVEYEELISLMISGIQEQQVELNTKDSLIDNLNDRLTLLEECLSNILPALCQANNMVIENTPDEIQNKLNSILDVELRNGNNIVLNQNVPNPFAERTVITYSIPESVGKAQIHFYDGNGSLISSVDINERGNGQMNVCANDLSTGIYTYSLVADGKIVSTKRMMKN